MVKMDSPDSLDSPLDFSTKRVKLENGTAAAAVNSVHQTSLEEEEESRSHLRSRLSMKSPVMLENLPGAILNLSKVSPTSGWMLKSSDSRSDSCSPPFQASPPIYTHHISASSTSPNLPFGTTLPSLPLPTSNGIGNGNNSLKARTTRPFKAYPKDPMSFSAVGLYGLPLGTNPGSSEAVIHQQSHVAYAEFRKQMLSQSQGGKSRRGGQRNNGSGLSDGALSPNDPLNYGSSVDTGANSSAEDSHSAPEDGGNGKNEMSNKSEQQLKDEAYWERRRKNNEAAKRSRDARRAKEDEIAIRAAFLEQENLKLRFELCALKQETQKLRVMLYSS